MNRALLTARQITIQLSDRLCRQPKRDLLKGQLAGRPLFLAWTLGVFVSYSLKIGLIISGSSDSLAMAACMLCLSVWQSVLLLPTWGKRLVWILILYALLLPVMDSTVRQTSYDPILLAALFQAILLIGVRRRVFLWVTLAVMANPFALIIVAPMSAIYDYASNQIAAFIPANFILKFSDIYPVVMTVAYGAIAALFMPPVLRSEEPRFALNPEI